MVEQNANMALSIADHGYVLQTGSIVLSDTAENLLCNEMMQQAYLGGADVCEKLWLENINKILVSNLD